MTDNVTLLDRLRALIENEPVRFMEMVRVALFSVAGLTGTVLSAPTVGTIVGLVAIAVSFLGSQKVRDKVTPYWKVENGTFNESVAESVAEYESSD